MDEKGRLKIPNGFLQLIESKFGLEMFVTSLSGENVRLYPMEVWSEIERKLATVPDSHPAKGRFLERVNYYGQAAALDRQGRLVIPSQLREDAQMLGSVDVLGKQNFLEIWSHERLLEKLRRDPFTDADARALAEFGI